MKIKTFIYCIIGSVLEWYDFALFGILSPLFSSVFFPHFKKNIATLLTLALFSIGFFARPLGGILFGHIGDRYGRKKAIVLSVFLMTIGTAGIGLLPVNSDNTMLIVMLFVGLRLTQGLSAGGELSGMVTFISEVYANNRMVFYLSLLSLGIVIGMLVGSLSGQLLFSKHNFIHNNLWRIPFLSSILLGGAGVYLRLNALESPVFLVVYPSFCKFKY